MKSIDQLIHTKHLNGGELLIGGCGGATALRGCPEPYLVGATEASPLAFASRDKTPRKIISLKRDHTGQAVGASRDR